MIDKTMLTEEDRKLLKLAGTKSAEGLFIGLLVLGIHDMRKQPGGRIHAARLAEYLVGTDPQEGHGIPPRRLARLKLLQRLFRYEDIRQSHPDGFSPPPGKVN